MKVKISRKVLTISPYLSTEWKNISSIQLNQTGKLLIALYDGGAVEIPSLDQASIDTIFEAHARYSDREVAPVTNPLESPYTFSLPLTNGGALPAMAHNPEQANLAPLPIEVLQKIGAVTRALGLDDSNVIPQGEPHCNCLYCQVARAMHEESLPVAAAEEIVDTKELSFRSSWDIQQTGEKLYLVTNPLDKNEHYNVFLGTPIGCTCGEKNCEHLRAVLSS